MRTTAVVVLTLLLTSPAPLPAAEFYVAPGGDDANAGNKDQPFATLHRAQFASRQARAQGQPVTVFLRGGTHYLTKPLVFEPQDSGTKEAPVVYRAYEKETPVISGGAKLNLKWEAFRDGISKANVPDGLTTDHRIR